MGELHTITSFSDPRIAAYANLKDRDLARKGNRFIAEGEQVVRRLLASDYPTESLLVAENRLNRIEQEVPPDVPVYVGPAALVNSILGFKFHSGIMAVGRRKTEMTLEKLLPPPAMAGKPLTLVICPETNNTENIGCLIRIAAGFGVDAMLLGPQCCDPFWRQSIRVSMGNIFHLPILQTDDLHRDLRRLRQQWSVEHLATVLDEHAEPLSPASRQSRHISLLFGNEAHGLGDEWLAECRRRITIPMRMGTDSLNVSVAAGILLYEMTRQI